MTIDPVASYLAALGMAVREAREVASLSAGAVAARARLSVQAIEDIERGAHRVTFADVVALAHALDVDVAHLARRAEALLPAPRAA